jgi:hypothetical protein
MSKTLRVLLATAALVFGVVPAAQATLVNAGFGQWYNFSVDDLFGAPPPDVLQWFDDGTYGGLGSPLSFAFTLTTPGTLRVVDASNAGDQFSVRVNGTAYPTTVVPAGSTAFEADFDAAFARPGDFSRLVLALAPGAYVVTGFLTVPNDPMLQATNGGLQVTAIPEPATWAVLLGGLLLLGAAARRRA